jgi:glycosyltransferase involved in cell wall biosynthesis
MKICFALPNVHIGGFRTFALNLGSAFIEDGHEAHALIVARGQAVDDLGDIDSVRKELPVHLCTQRRVLWRSRFIRRIVRLIEDINPDVLLVNHTLWVQAALPYLPSHLKRIVVVHNTTQEELALPRGNANWWDAAVAVGPGVQEELLKSWPESRVRLIPVGVREAELAPRTDFRRPELQICYIGRLAQEQKNILLIPRIAIELSKRKIPFRWLIIGDGPDRAHFERTINVTGLRPQFDLVGVCNQNEVQRLLAQQDVLILPSFYESIGHVLQEAQMLGVVPVATNLEKSTAFVITEQQTGRLCRSGEAADFGAAIAALHADRDELQRLSQNARASVRERFDISRLAQQWYGLFCTINRTGANHQPARAGILGNYTVAPELLPSRLTTGAKVLSRQMGSRGAK